MAKTNRTNDANLILKWKKKRWFSVKTPDFGDKIIGEIMAENVEQTIGKTMKINLMTIMNDPRKQSQNIIFKITRSEASSPIAEVQGLQMVNAMVKRLVRKNKTKIDDSFIVTTKDGKYVIFKPIVVAYGRISKNVASSIRKTMRTYLLDYFENTEYKTFVNDVLTDKLVSKLRTRLYKINPIFNVKVRMFKLLEKPTNWQKLIIEKFKEEVKNYGIDLKENKEDQE